MASAVSAQTPLVISVENELNKARDSLRRLDDDIRMLTGRSVDDQGARFGRGRGAGRFSSDEPSSKYNSGDLGQRFRGGVESGRLLSGRVGQKRRISGQGDSDNDAADDSWKRPRIASEYSRATRFVSDALDSDAPSAKPAIQSSVTMPLKEMKSREEAITELKGSEAREVSVRNRRMFGVLMSTLKKFKNEEEKHSFRDQERKQREIETRLEEAKRKERMQVEQERQKLLDKRRRQEQDIRRLQRKRALIAATDNQIALLRRLQNFIQTNTKPSIFFMPAKHTIRTIELQKKSQKKLEELIKAKQEETDLQLKQMDDGALGPLEEDEEHEDAVAVPVPKEEEDASADAGPECTAEPANGDSRADASTSLEKKEEDEPQREAVPSQPKDIQDELKELTAGYAEDLNFDDDEQQR